ncbi:hypothetical protein TFLX_04936 [Thermoflexales bacterium]|nr:hypothetical protein TFLX_04936 [Thermoflexales bacterium]
MAENEVYPCPCCGYLVLSEPPGSYDICPICFWEDDVSQLRFMRIQGGANQVSLIEGQKNYMAFGVCEQHVKPHVRSPRSDETKESDWRPIDPDIDNIEDSIPGIDYGTSYPEDYRRLYYWRNTYWRRSTP